MSKFDYPIGVCSGKITEIRADMYVVYEREAGNLGQDMKITAEDCKERIQRFQGKIAELNAAIKILDQIKKED